MEQQIVKVYSGKANKCMCGCAGKWSYTAYGAAEHNPGYAPNVNERSVKIIAAKVLRDPNKQVDKDANCVFVQENDRVRVVYFG